MKKMLALTMVFFQLIGCIGLHAMAETADDIPDFFYADYMSFCFNYIVERLELIIPDDVKAITDENTFNIIVEQVKQTLTLDLENPLENDSYFDMRRQYVTKMEDGKYLRYVNADKSVVMSFRYNEDANPDEEMASDVILEIADAMNESNQIWAELCLAHTIRGLDKRIEWGDLNDWFNDEQREDKPLDMDNYIVSATHGRDFHSITISRKNLSAMKYCFKPESVVEALNLGIVKACPATVIVPGLSSSLKGSQSQLKDLNLKFMGSDNRCIYYANELSNMYMLAVFLEDMPVATREADAIAVMLNETQGKDNYHIAVTATGEGFALLDKDFNSDGFQNWLLKDDRDQHPYEFDGYSIAYRNVGGMDVLILTSLSCDASALDIAEKNATAFCKSEDKTIISRQNAEADGISSSQPSIFDE